MVLLLPDCLESLRREGKMDLDDLGVGSLPGHRFLIPGHLEQVSKTDNLTFLPFPSPSQQGP